MSLMRLLSQRCLVGNEVQTLPLSSQAWDGVQAHGLRKTRVWFSTLVTTDCGKLSRLCLLAQCSVSQKGRTGYFLILKVAPACYIRK